MLKKLGQIRVGAIAWIVGGCFVIGAIVFVASQQHAAAKKYETEREKRCTSAFPLNPEKQDACKHERDSGSDYLAWWYVLFTWPEGITVWALLLTLCVIMYQSYHTRRAADGALLNAEAALKQARFIEQQVALQRSQRRGVLEVSCQPIEADTLARRQTWFLIGIINLTNSGEFPLQIRGGRGGFFFDKSGAVDLLGEFNQLNCINAWIRPKGHGHVEVFYSPEITESRGQFWQMLTTTDLTQFRLEGTIHYNSLGFNWSRNFSYRWTYDPDVWKLKNAEPLGIKKGHWEENPHGRNDEDELASDCPVPF
jgi:hypothetical protein